MKFSINECIQVFAQGTLRDMIKKASKKKKIKNEYRESLIQVIDMVMVNVYGLLVMGSGSGSGYALGLWLWLWLWLLLLLFLVMVMVVHIVILIVMIHTHIHSYTK